MKIFTVVEVGCLECENPHTMVGTFLSKDEAIKALNQYGRDNPRDGWYGYSLEIFESDLDVQNPYIDTITLSEKSYEQLLDTLDNPPEPTEALIKVMKEYKEFQKD